MVLGKNSGVEKEESTHLRNTTEIDFLRWFFSWFYMRERKESNLLITTIVHRGGIKRGD